MARLNRWTSPLTIEQTSCSIGRDAHAATITLHIHPRRWHPAWWWMVVSQVDPRYLWRPDAWARIVHVGLTAGKG